MSQLNIVPSSDSEHGPSPTAEVALDPDNGDWFISNGSTLLHVRNTDSTDHTITFTRAIHDFRGDFTGDVEFDVVNIPAGKEAVFGPFDPQLYGLDLDREIVSFRASDASLLAFAFSMKGFPNDPSPTGLNSIFSTYTLTTIVSGKTQTIFVANPFGLLVTNQIIVSGSGGTDSPRTIGALNALGMLTITDRFGINATGKSTVTKKAPPPPNILASISKIQVGKTLTVTASVTANTNWVSCDGTFTLIGGGAPGPKTISSFNAKSVSASLSATVKSGIWYTAILRGSCQYLDGTVLGGSYPFSTTQLIQVS